MMSCGVGFFSPRLRRFFPFDSFASFTSFIVAHMFDRRALTTTPSSLAKATPIIQCKLYNIITPWNVIAKKNLHSYKKMTKVTVMQIQ